MRTLARTVQSASLAASALAGNVVALVLFLNPELTLSREAPALVLALFLPYVLAAAAVLLLVALLGGLLRFPFSARPPLPSVPWFTSLAFLATFASAVLYWLNLWEYRHSIPVEFLRGLTAAAVAVSLAALVLLGVMLDLLLFPARGRAAAAALVVLVPALSVALPLALRPRPEARPGTARVTAEPIRPARRVVLFGVDGLSLDLLRAGLEKGTQPVFARLMKRGAHGPLATLRPTEAPPLWTSILTGRLPRDHGVKRFSTYRLRGSDSTYELLPSFAFVSLLERLRLVASVPVTARDRRAAALWDHLAAFSVPSGFVRMWGSFPAGRFPGFALSNYFHRLHAEPARAGETLYPRDLLPEVSARAVSARDLSPETLLEFVDASAFDDAFPWRRELIERALAPDLTYERAGAVLRTAYDPPFFATYVYGLDVVGHAFLRFAEPDRFGDVRPDELRRYGRVLDRYLALVGERLFEAERALGPNDVLVVVSAYGMQPVPLWRRLFSPRERSGTHAGAPDGLLLLVGGGVKAGAGLRSASLLDVAPTLLYLAGLPVGRDMEGRVLAEAFEETFARTHPVSYIPSYESVVAARPEKPGPEASPGPRLDDLAPFSDDEP
jgi:hypothetical protein